MWLYVARSMELNWELDIKVPFLRESSKTQAEITG
jgi:hypothetical protein